MQYTSGSTRNPAGVMITHENLVEWSAGITDRLKPGPQWATVNWVPVTHDMGLVLEVLLPVIAGWRSIMMSAGSFLDDPVRWLELASRFRAQTICAPQFGYDMCVRRSSEEQRAAIDLSSIEILINGAEPVPFTSFTGFMKAFEVSGLKPSSASDGYGLAENTLTISIPAYQGIRYVRLDDAALRAGRIVAASGETPAREIVSCGHPLSGQEVAIVDPAGRTRLTDWTEGEIWVAGKQVAPGYWQRPEETAATFHATIEGEGETRYLRTGDLGFMVEGELYVTGRLKDMIVVRGDNYYPQDLELAVQEAHHGVRPGCVAAVPLEREAGEES